MDTKTKTKSIFSGMGGLISALAGLVTVILGLLAIGSQVGWFDSGSKTKDGTEVTTGDETQTAPGATGSGSGSPGAGSQGGQSSSAVRPRIALRPDPVEFEPLGATEATVTVENIGSTAASVQGLTVRGEGADAFQATDVDCVRSTIAPDSSCQLKVKFVASKAGEYEATLVLPVANSDTPAELTLKGNKLL